MLTQPLSSAASTHEFRFVPPAPEEARAFALQLAGSLLALLGLALVFWRLESLRPVSLGAAAGLIYVVARSAWALELRARRSQLGGIAVDEAGVRLHDGRREQALAWSQIQTCEVRGGKLHLNGAGDAGERIELAISAREVEDGVKLIEEIAVRWKNGGKRGFVAPSNFIPLSPS